jgi:hypothetical protein
MRSHRLLVPLIAAAAACSDDLGQVGAGADSGGLPGVDAAGPPGADAARADDPDAAPDLPDDAARPPPERVTDGIVALYRFDEGSGETVGDSSGVSPALDLTITDPAALTWLDGGGLEITAATLVASADPASKIAEACQATDELTLEAWLEPAALAETSTARVITCSADADNRNFALLQSDTTYIARLRTDATSLDGEPATDSAVDAATGSLQHVVFTRDATEAVLYVDGAASGSQALTGGFGVWDASYVLAVGNEPTLDRPWLGALHLVAVYCRALDGSEIEQNRAAGP